MARWRHRYLLGDGALLPFRAASVDAVTAFMSLMDVADPGGRRAACRRADRGRPSRDRRHPDRPPLPPGTRP